MVEQVCALAGSFDVLATLREEMTALATAVSTNESTAILDWLLETLSFQGISDAIVRSYIDSHPRVSSGSILTDLATAICPKLECYWSFERCGFEKTWGSCNVPSLIGTCPLPDLDLRNGRLNQTAYALNLFCRDVAGGDLVSWIDTRLSDAVPTEEMNQRSRWAQLRRALLEPLGHVVGVSDKVLSMAMSDFLIGTGDGRPDWIETGVVLIAIDTLVHNWLHRSGVAHRWGEPHQYGPKCYRAGGCAEVIELLALDIDARQFDLEFPQAFPRFVQKAIWSFCAQSEFDRCNGVRINDRVGCQDQSCPLFQICDRRPLRI